MRQGTKLSAPARHLISSILVLLVAPFPGAHGNGELGCAVASKIGWMVINLRNCPIKQQFS